MTFYRMATLLFYYNIPSILYHIVARKVDNLHNTSITAIDKCVIWYFTIVVESRLQLKVTLQNARVLAYLDTYSK